VRRLAITLAVTAATLASTAAAQAARTSNWWWTPAACKSELGKGVQIDDGRYFFPTITFCIGTASSCAWNSAHTTRLYQSFYVIMRSGDGVVRTMNLRVTGKNSWRGESIRLRYRYMNATKFAVYTRVVATAYAQEQNSYGCKSGVLGP
jgi:hypothetical protein